MSDIMTKNPITASPNESLLDAARIMGRKHIGSLVVTEGEDAVGIVTERDLMTRVIARFMSWPELGDVEIRSVMSAALAEIEPSSSVKDAARAMISQKSRLLILDGLKPIGIVTASDLVRVIPDCEKTEWKVDDAMNPVLETVDGNCTIDQAAQIMGHKRIGSVLVRRKEEVDGIFTERDFLTKVLARNMALNNIVEKLASFPLICVKSGTLIHNAAKLMARKHIRRLPVQKGRRLIGVVTARDIVEIFAR